MSDDISEILADWPHDPEAGLQVRRVVGSDDRPKLQIRLDLGLLQMEAVGRPDGKQPAGHPSLLQYYERAAEAHRRRHGWYEGFELDGADCAQLRAEALQYYQRRVACMALGDYAAAIADAEHNLRILDLVRAFASEADDRSALEKFRAFITAHRVRCEVLQHLQEEDVQAAILEWERGLEELRELFAAEDRLAEFSASPEKALLDELRGKLDAHHLLSHRQNLQLRLDEALRREDPDVAAELRARLRELERE